MDFPDMKSLERCADVWKFRPLNEGESEDAYRSALADFVEPHDLVASCEIRNTVGWNKFTRPQQIDLLIRSGRRSR